MLPNLNTFQGFALRCSDLSVRSSGRNQLPRWLSTPWRSYRSVGVHSCPLPEKTGILRQLSGWEKLFISWWKTFLSYALKILWTLFALRWCGIRLWLKLKVGKVSSIHLRFFCSSAVFVSSLAMAYHRCQANAPLPTRIALSRVKTFEQNPLRPGPERLPERLRTVPSFRFITRRDRKLVPDNSSSAPKWFSPERTMKPSYCPSKLSDHPCFTVYVR